ncbi:MAG: amino acid ABC transporter permease, partial [Clostridiales bacterium]|nr:amino acid ABC transporter permease [Clostridiales bacterium]
MENLRLFWNRFTNPGTLKSVLLGLQNTAIIAVCGLLLGFLIGCILATVQIIPSKNIFARIAKKIEDIYVAIFPGTPMMVQLLLFHFAVFAAVRIEPVA